MVKFDAATNEYEKIKNLNGGCWEYEEKQIHTCNHALVGDWDAGGSVSFGHINIGKINDGGAT